MIFTILWFESVFIFFFLKKQCLLGFNIQVIVLANTVDIDLV